MKNESLCVKSEGWGVKCNESGRFYGVLEGKWMSWGFIVGRATNNDLERCLIGRRLEIACYLKFEMRCANISNSGDIQFKN